MQLQSLPSIVKSSLSMTLPKVLWLPTAGKIVIIIQRIGNSHGLILILTQKSEICMCTSGLSSFSVKFMPLVQIDDMQFAQ